MMCKTVPPLGQSKGISPIATLAWNPTFDDHPTIFCGKSSGDATV